MSYGVFARYYDLFTGNVDYKAYALRIEHIAKSLGIKRGSLVDLGCGTASLSMELARLGYRVTGVDISCEMLTAAAEKLYNTDLRVRLINQDMTRLELFKKADIFVSSLDGLNHLDSLDDIKKTFSGVAKHLTAGGIFIFDMNTLYKHRHILQDNAFIFDSDEAFLAWQNELNREDSSVKITLDFFIPSESGTYERCTEEFLERAYRAEDIAKALKDCGLRLIAVYDGLTENEPCKTTERVLFVVKK